MKKLFFILLCCILLCNIGCAGNQDNLPDEQDILKYNRYYLQTYTLPVWEGNVVYNETVMFVGSDDQAPLLYTPDKILAVKSYDLLTTYVSGVDYFLQDNKICLTENSTIPFFADYEYYPSVYTDGKSFHCSRKDKPYIFFSEGDTICKRQLAVTYTHKDKSMATPKTYKNNFTKSLKKLTSGEKVNIVFYGDSITTGANSSKIIGCGPLAESFPEMVTSYLKFAYNNQNINYINTAQGGTSVVWGSDNLEQLVINHQPDLLVLGFGMNDVYMAPEVYKSHIVSIIDKLRQKMLDCDIMLVSPMLANKEVKGFYGNQELFEQELIDLAKVYPGMGVAEVTKMHKEILKTKRYYDMTGNNVNHPNDFLARIYAQTILQSFMNYTV